MTSRRALVLAAPGLVYLGVRQLGVLILLLMAQQHDGETGALLTAWDGQWFLSIAESGYGGVPDGMSDATGNRSDFTPLAFFPGYPTVVGTLSDLTGIGVASMAFAVTILSGLVAAYGIYRIGTLVRGGSRRVGLVLVALFAASPMSIVLSMTYSEALFCACAAWVLVFLLRQEWMLAAALCAIAGMVRITAAALVLALIAAVVVFLVRSRGTASRAEKLTAVGACVIAPAGLIAWLWRAGALIEPDAGVFAQIGAWSEVQSEGWGSEFDWGAATADFVLHSLVHEGNAYQLGMVAAILAAVVLAVVCCVRRQEWPLLVYGLAVLASVIGTAGIMNSKARLLVPAFTLLIPLAMWLARRRPVPATLVLLGAALTSGWFGAYGLLVWEYAI